MLSLCMDGYRRCVFVGGGKYVGVLYGSGVIEQVYRGPGVVLLTADCKVSSRNCFGIMPRFVYVSYTIVLFNVASKKVRKKTRRKRNPVCDATIDLFTMD